MLTDEKNILVTGGAGFIGSHICASLVKEGYQVFMVDNLSTGLRENIPKRVEFIHGDVGDPSFIQTLSKYRFSKIYHVAGQSGGESSYDNPVYDLRSNTQSTLLLLGLCREVGCNQFVFTSTFSVYGNVAAGSKARETTEAAPNSFYAVGKLASEKYLRIYSEQFGVNSLVLRLPSIYGPGQNLEFLKQGIVSIYLGQAINKESILVKGSPKRFRDLLHVSDIISFLEGFDFAHFKGFEIVNLCSGSATTVEEIINLIQRFLPHEVPVEYKGGTPGDVFGVLGDNGKALRDHNWSPQIRPDEGIRAMVGWAASKSKGRSE